MDFNKLEQKMHDTNPNSFPLFTKMTEVYYSFKDFMFPLTRKEKTLR